MRKLILSLAAIAALASCSKDNENPTPSYDPNEIRVASQALEATTKAPFEGSTIDATDHVLLAYVPTTTTENDYTTLYNSGNSGDCIKFTNNQATGFCDATGNTPQPKYYPASGEVWICGLYPAADWTNLSTTATHSIEGNTDIMAAAQKKSVKGGEVQTLAFKHLLTKLNITFIAETGAATQWGKVTKIELTAVGEQTPANSITVTLATGVKANTAQGTGALPCYVWNGGDNYTDTEFEGQEKVLPGAEVVAGQAAAYTICEAIKSDGTKDYTLKVYTTNATQGVSVDVACDTPGDMTGKEVDVKLTFKASEIQAIATVTDWADGGTATGDVQG